MFIGYSDASINDKKLATLAFVVVFEDKKVIKRRIVVEETNSNIAEALAFRELISFLDYYNIKKGMILFDSKCLKSHLKKTGMKKKKYVSKDSKEILSN